MIAWRVTMNPRSPTHSWTWFARQRIPLPSHTELGEHSAHQVSMDYYKWAFRGINQLESHFLGPTFLPLPRLGDGAALLAADESRGNYRIDTHGKFEPIWKVCWPFRVLVCKTRGAVAVWYGSGCLGGKWSTYVIRIVARHKSHGYIPPVRVCSRHVDLFTRQSGIFTFHSACTDYSVPTSKDKYSYLRLKIWPNSHNVARRGLGNGRKYPPYSSAMMNLMWCER